MANKVSVKKIKAHQYDVKFSGLTAGEVMSMKHALENYAEISAVAKDVSAYLNNGLQESGLD